MDSETLQDKCTPIFIVPDDVGKVLLAIFEIVLYVGGIVAVVFVVYGGFLYLTSSGEPEKAKNARTTIINALIGLAITMLATAIVNLIGRNLAT
ncbi:MAG TPA: pilin [Verrucomicrobiae bacterium]|nr:pilin [Verrucomicrobiae bacterium]